MTEENENRRIAVELEKLMTLRMDYIESMMAKSEKMMDQRFHSMNEFREQLKEQARGFMHKDESVRMHDTTSVRLSRIETDMASIVGKMWAFGVSITIFLTIVNLLLRYAFK